MKGASQRPPSHSKSMISVHILRQTHVDTRGQKAWRNKILGEGEVWEIPPIASSIDEPQDATHLDWEGEVRCEEDVSVGGFQTANVVVKVCDPACVLDLSVYI